MSDKQLWMIPFHREDMEPSPVLLDERNEFWDFDRKSKTFVKDPVEDLFRPTCYDTFEECRAAMIEGRTQALDESREHSRYLAASIEHIRSLPHAQFPDVIREVREAPQEEAEGQEEAKAEETVAPQPEVEPAKGEARPALKRPSRSK
jgi:hypothetical protein